MRIAISRLILSLSLETMGWLLAFLAELSRLVAALGTKGQHSGQEEPGDGFITLLQPSSP